MARNHPAFSPTCAAVVLGALRASFAEESRAARAVLRRGMPHRSSFAWSKAGGIPRFGDSDPPLLFSQAQSLQPHMIGGFACTQQLPKQPNRITKTNVLFVCG